MERSDNLSPALTKSERKIRILSIKTRLNIENINNFD